MKRTYAYRDGKMVEITPPELKQRPEVMPDLQGFRSTDGAWIDGQAQWKEHLNRTGLIEMGHTDIQAQQEKWEQKKQKHQERLSRNTGEVRPADIPADTGPTERSRLTSEMLNRLDGRPAPDRKTLIKLARETALDLKRRG